VWVDIEDAPADLQVDDEMYAIYTPRLPVTSSIESKIEFFIWSTPTLLSIACTANLACFAIDITHYGLLALERLDMSENIWRTSRLSSTKESSPCSINFCRVTWTISEGTLHQRLIYLGHKEGDSFSTACDFMRRFPTSARAHVICTTIRT
jgi:hypothetical protein